MKHFNEVVLYGTVKKEMAPVYKKAIEAENERIWVENVITTDGKTTKEIKPVWGGCTAHVEITEDKEEGKAGLTLTLVSRTLPNLEETARSYESDGMKILSKNY
jgi:hypothetical protein